MTTDRGRLSGLKQLIDLQEPGGYTLPGAVLDAWQTSQQVAALKPDAPEAFFHDAAAEELVAVVAAGQEVDLAAAGRRVRHAVEAGATTSTRAGCSASPGSSRPRPRPPPPPSTPTSSSPSTCAPFTTGCSNRRGRPPPT